MKKIRNVIAIIILMLLYTACSGGTGSINTKSDMSTMDFSESPDDIGYLENGTSEKSEYPKSLNQRGINQSYSGEETPNLPEDQDFIVRTTLEVETENFDKAVKSINKMTKDLKGYIEESDGDYGDYYNKSKIRRVSYRLRIPKGNTQTAVNTVKSEVGVVVREEQNTENVTKRIKDLNRDIDLLKAKEDRLIELSKKSGDLDSLIRIETEIASTISQREYTQAQLQNVQHDVQYDYLTIYLREVRQEMVIETNDFSGDIKTAFRDSIDEVVNFFQNSVIFLVRNWFNIILLALTVMIVIIVIKKVSKKEKRLERDNNQTQNMSKEINRNKDEMDTDNISETGEEIKSKYKKQIKK